MKKEKNVVEQIIDFVSNKRNLPLLLLLLGGTTTVVTTAVAIRSSRVPTNSSVSTSGPSQGSNSNGVPSSSTPTSFPSTVTMTFDSKGGTSVAAITITNFTTNTGPENPTREFHNFQAWYYDEAFTRSVNFSTDFLNGFYPATGDLTVYAKWIPYQSIISFKYLDSSDREQISRSFFVPMLTCSADYNLTIPALPVSNNLNMYTYADWDLSVLPDCLNSEAHLNIDIFANKVFKEYTFRLITPTFYTKATDMAMVTGVDLVFLTPDHRVISRGRNVFGAPNVVSQFDNSTIATYDVTPLLPLHTDEHVIRVFSIFEQSQSGNNPETGMLFLTNQHRVIDFNNVTDHGTGNKFEDLTPRLGLLENETITFMDSGSLFFMILTSTNRLIAYGNVPGYTQSDLGQVINTTTAFGDDVVIDFTIGLTNVALRTEAGSVGVFGRANYGNLGLVDVYQTALVKLDDFTNVTFIKAIENRLYLIGDKGSSVNKVFGTGVYLNITSDSNVETFTELTHFDTANDYYQPLAANESIVEIAGFLNDTVFLTSLGRTLAIGTNTYKNTGPTSNIVNTLRDETEFFGVVSQETLDDRGTGVYFMPIFGITFSMDADTRIRAKGNNSFNLLSSTIASSQITDEFYTPTYATYSLFSSTLVGYNQPLVFPTVPVIEGYTATGWFTQLTNGTNGTSFSKMYAQDMTFYAIYSESVN